MLVILSLMTDFTSTFKSFWWIIKGWKKRRREWRCWRRRRQCCIL